MTTRLIAGVLAISFAFGWLPVIQAADQTINQNLSVLDEKVNRLNAQMEDLLIRVQQQQKDIDKITGELQELRRVAAAGGGVSQAELKSLEDRIQAVDNARQKDRQVIIDQLAKELAGVSSGKLPRPPVADSKVHVVQKGEYLATIARKYGVSIADLKKVNNLTGDDIKTGQKLTIPK
jgi:LysM repeat protein